jgi:hypothetical protein
MKRQRKEERKGSNERNIYMSLISKFTRVCQTIQQPTRGIRLLKEQLTLELHFTSPTQALEGSEPGPFLN